ncbi:MAG: hypothetical protein KIT83_11315 [Bryobacterales bacterium]|nr:hypothetical protein [Bryobacterales bacterium]
MSEHCAPEGKRPAGDDEPSTREQARQILGTGLPREQIRRELWQAREAELKKLLHEAAVLDASPFWREIALRRFIRERGANDGRQDP